MNRILPQAVHQQMVWILRDYDRVQAQEDAPALAALHNQAVDSALDKITAKFKPEERYKLRSALFLSGKDASSHQWEDLDPGVSKGYFYSLRRDFFKALAAELELYEGSEKDVGD